MPSEIRSVHNEVQVESADSDSDLEDSSSDVEESAARRRAVLDVPMGTEIARDRERSTQSNPAESRKRAQNGERTLPKAGSSICHERVLHSILHKTSGCSRVSINLHAS